MGRVSNIHRASLAANRFRAALKRYPNCEADPGGLAPRHVDMPVSPFHRSCGTRAANFAAKAALMLS
jgi:hypothetical protein